MIKVILKYRKIIIILFVIFSLLWITNKYLSLKYGRNMKAVFVKIDTSDDVFKRITVYRISPSGNNNIMKSDLLTKSFYYLQDGYFKSIKIDVPTHDLDKLKKVKVVIGNKVKLYTKDTLIHNWESNKNNNIISFNSPEEIRYSNSRIPLFKNIINWPGDISFFFISYLEYFFVFLLLSLLIIFFNRYLNNNIFARNITNYDNNSFLENINYFIDNNEKYKFIYNTTIWSLFLAVVLFAFLQRMILNQLPYASGDIGGYLGPAIKYFDTGNFTHINGRSFPYPLFILIILKVSNDFIYISLTQHLIGLLTGLLIFLSWKELFIIFNYDKKYKIIHDLLGLLVSSVYLFSESVIVYEHIIGRESIYPLFLILQVFIFFKIINCIKSDGKIIYFWGNLFFFNNYLLYIYQPRYGLTLFLNIIIHFIFFIILRRKMINKILFYLILPFLLFFLLLYLPENKIIKNETATDSFLAMHLFFGHAKIIDIELEKDIKNKNYNKYDKEILIEIRKAFNEAFNTPQTKHRYLGYDFNEMVYSGWINNYLKSKLSKKKYEEFCFYYFFRSIIKHPTLYLKKVILELSQFYNIKGYQYTFKDYIIGYVGYEGVYDRLNINFENSYLPYHKYINSVDYLRKSIYDVKGIRCNWTNTLLFLIAKINTFIIIIFLIIFIVNVYKYSQKNKNDLLNLLIIISVLLINFFISLTIAMVYTYDVSRYFDDHMIIVLFSAFVLLEYFFMQIVNVKNRGETS